MCRAQQVAWERGSEHGTEGAGIPVGALNTQEARTVETMTVNIPVDDVVAQKIARLEEQLAEARGVAINHECDAVFWQARCEKAERERDAGTVPVRRR